MTPKCRFVRFAQLVSAALLVAAAGSGAAAPRARGEASPSSLAVQKLGEGVRAFRAGAHAAAARHLRQALEGQVRNQDYATHYLAESLAALGKTGEAIRLFERVARVRGSRFANPARWRAVDLRWEAGERSAAARQYERLVSARVPGGDRAKALVRVGEDAAARGAPAAARAAFEKLLVDDPSHPLVPEAERRLVQLDDAPEGSPDVLSPRLRLARAQRLSDRRRWDEAISELEALAVPPELEAERAFVLGQAKYRSRKNYGDAARLLASAAQGLSGEKATWAAFHAARALSRADRDDEAIAAYLAFSRAYPRATYAAEAQFLAGWLDFNRGRFAEGIPALAETLRRFGKTPYAADAAWYLALSDYFQGDARTALTHLDEFAARTRDGKRRRIWPEDRVTYWRARCEQTLGHDDVARSLYTKLVAAEPLRWYGLLAAARLAAQNHAVPLALPRGEAPLAPLDRKARRDPALLRVDELLAAGLPHDAGLELESGAEGVLTRLGRERGLAAVIDRSQAAGVWAKAYRLADVLGSRALGAAPEGAVRRIWQTVFPLAYRPLVETYAAAAGNPDHYLYAIMHKESGFDPNVVSYADARGLLQMIPPTSRRVAASLGEPFADETLLDPETNIRLGAHYIGALYRKFNEQVPLAAGSYNAGPNAMARWLDRHGAHPLDEFVELVSYEQTREYIKRVTGIYARYRYLYAQERYLPNLEINARYRDDGPNY